MLLLVQLRFAPCNSGHTYGNATLATITLGSGGGSGGSHLLTTNPPGGRGGHGGGSVHIVSRGGHITITGVLVSEGGHGEGEKNMTMCQRDACPTGCVRPCSQTFSDSNDSCWDQSGPGGGGAGGSIYLQAALVNITGRLSVAGGHGGVGLSWASGCGGSGGDGRIRIGKRLRLIPL